MADFINMAIKCPCCGNNLTYCVSRDMSPNTVRVYVYCDECAIETKSFPYGNYLAKSDYELIAKAIWKRYVTTEVDVIDYIRIRRTLKEKAPDWVTFKNRREIDRFKACVKAQESITVKSPQKTLGDFQ